MLEIPESHTVGLQVDKTLKNKVIVDVIEASSPHKFAWYNGDPANYHKLLVGKKINSAKGTGAYVTLFCDDDVKFAIGDGTNLRYYEPKSKYPGKHQLLLVLNDDSYLMCTVAMYGAIYAFKNEFDNKYYQLGLNSVSPLEDAFNETFFDEILKSVKKDVSVKALLATEQRIPGVGNGVLQDILFNARIHPKRKTSTLTDADKSIIFNSLKSTIKQMTDAGGRDTEKDLFGNTGGYKTILSKRTIKYPCPVCGDTIHKEAYLGGAVYYCPTCQPLVK